LLYVFGFESIGVVVSDLYFADPEPNPGQEGAERGVRLEVRMLERGELRGSIYSAQPIAVGRPIWRGDLLESVAGPPGSHDRTHHHPRFTGWEPDSRHFVDELSADPLGWVAAHLEDLDGLLADGGVSPEEIDPRDRDSLRAAVPEIVDSVRKLLHGVRSGEFAKPPAEEVVSARVGWL
jgi:hypothetical protein